MLYPFLELVYILALALNRFGTSGDLGLKHRGSGLELGLQLHKRGRVSFECIVKGRLPEFHGGCVLAFGRR